MNYLHYEQSVLAGRGALHTAREISQQPRLWRELMAGLIQNKLAWKAWMLDVLSTPNLRIILCGAGTSAFAGRTLEPWLRASFGLAVEAISTTDIVSQPLAYLDSSRPTLMVSFARSGNSPESVAAVNLASQLLPYCRHLVLTCNPQGELAQYSQDNPHAYCVLMPEGANDQSFAMTSSFSCMFVAAAVMLTPGVLLSRASEQIEAVAAFCESRLESWASQARALAGKGFKRVIYLGSGEMTGLAEEAALKMLELSAGQIATRFDSCLGVRHGPKFMIDSQSCVLMFMAAADSYTRRYDDDLQAEVIANGIAQQVVALGPQSSAALPLVEVAIAGVDGLYLSLPYLLFAQLFAFESSLALGLAPDNPCPTGEVNRVVQGVKIYPYPA
ncbi:SIS domain-containing protein [Iodobacter ciconiae]|uniref:SIS domain-containing protein n=1 Tax=Iodobacter ciconiae TaxID=2496266 RepID=A0A3S8ZQS9_9NEIS|nr:SIS domain-containing protein [Iodobacter ciconiae]AZN35828.1 SIS domain-containing protein [Iodobacter ciconiae]